MNKSKYFGNFLIFLGIILVFAAGIVAGENLTADQFAKEQSDTLLRAVGDYIAEVRDLEAGYAVTPDYLLDDSRELPVVDVDGLPIIGYVSIPSLGLNLPVCSEWDAVNAKSAPCRYVGSVYDNSMIIGGHSYKAHFRGLWNVRTGERVEFTDMDGNVFAYQIAAVETLDEYDVEGLISADCDLSLFTCTSNSRGRVTVRCDLIESEVVR